LAVEICPGTPGRLFSPKENNKVPMKLDDSGRSLGDILLLFLLQPVHGSAACRILHHLKLFLV
jgi:hypothetical protein